MSVQTVFDFTRPEAVGAWWPVGDLVMSGYSENRVRAEDGALVFSGRLSRDQEDFSSIRSSAGYFDLAGFAGLVCLLRGDGRRYALGLRTEAVLDGTIYQASFIAPAGKWCDVLLPFAAFHPTWCGRPIDAPPLEPGLIRSFALHVADDRQGPFRLEVAAIRVVGEVETH
jgi:NADH dehydrogenase [ubiquinone] 1 alpha subcomplex assembly factor 1